LSPNPASQFFPEHPHIKTKIFYRERGEIIFMFELVFIIYASCLWKGNTLSTIYTESMLENVNEMPFEWRIQKWNENS